MCVYTILFLFYLFFAAHTTTKQNTIKLLKKTTLKTFIPYINRRTHMGLSLDLNAPAVGNKKRDVYTKALGILINESQ